MSRRDPKTWYGGKQGICSRFNKATLILWHKVAGHNVKTCMYCGKTWILGRTRRFSNG